ncbi:MAG TPA: hypothetical protein VGM58_02825 [Verrucomicrobiae bacterium]|jgi:hypothetical protein
MNNLRILHNGDPRNGSPHWWISVNERGSFFGEILMGTTGRQLANDFKLQETQWFFEIPPEFVERQIAIHPHHEEIILRLTAAPSGKCLCSFLLSDVTKDSDLRKAVEDVIEKISVLVKHFYPS